MRVKRNQICLFLVVVIALFWVVKSYTGRSATFCFKKWFGVRMPPCAESSMARFYHEEPVACFVFKADQVCLSEVEKAVLPNTTGHPVSLSDPQSVYAIIREDPLFIEVFKSNTPIIARHGVGGVRESQGVTFVTDKKSIAWVFVSPL